ncbi:MAG: DUF962 domain-containing protein [Verrucomicrobia bacterium]|nr:DUF962 domain-containing protein [Verrucomicrobiota bacterium]
MTRRKTADEWFAEYGESHQDHANELIHWICVPVIFCCVLGFVWTIPVPGKWLEAAPWFNWALVAMVLATLLYVRLSPALSAGLLLFMSLCYGTLVVVDAFVPWPVWKICTVAFVLAWIGQFIGHKIEGKKPSFFKDVAFLLIGPAWLMSFIYKKLGQRY